jgi:hypothetical protein
MSLKVKLAFICAASDLKGGNACAVQSGQKGQPICREDARPSPLSRVHKSMLIGQVSELGASFSCREVLKDWPCLSMRVTVYECAMSEVLCAAASETSRRRLPSYLSTLALTAIYQLKA